MDLTPDFAAIGERLGDLASKLVQMRKRPVAMMIPIFHGSFRTIQPEPRFQPLPESMNVCGRMIV
jgi:hypothetical protein